MNNLKKFGAMILALVLAFSLAIPAFAALDDTGFSDVDADAEYAEAVAWCVSEKLMQGVSATQFSPNGTLTRAMVATVLYRDAGEPAVSGASAFTDVQPGQWYSNAIAWANASGIVQGYGNGLFGTNNPITREQLDVILHRYMGENPAWTGNPDLAVPATRAETAVALYNNLRTAAPSETPNETPDNPPTETPTEQGGKTLVAYFSATNNTENIANHLKAILDADVYEIVPETPYTSADLNYGDSSSRTTLEMNDASARPAISGSVDNMDQYDVIYLGYPIWWGQAPKIICTFLESYDLSGKTIVPFCTSGSSGIGSSATNLHSLASNATWLDGHRFSGSASQSDVESWVNGLGLK